MLDGYCTEKVQKASKKWTQLSNENPSHNGMCFGIIENTPMKNFNTHQWTVARLRPGRVCCVHAASSLLGEEYRPATTQRLTMHRLQRGALGCVLRNLLLRTGGAALRAPGPGRALGTGGSQVWNKKFPRGLVCWNGRQLALNSLYRRRWGEPQHEHHSVLE
jgi:hypothetical protein